MIDRASIRSLTYKEFLESFADINEPAYKAGVTASFLYKHGVSSFDEISSLSLESRELLSKRYSLGEPRIVDRATGIDGSVKALFDWSGTIAEAVYMPSVKGRTLCLSVQSGCRLDCAFCATAKLGLKKNLTFGEILDQILYFSGEGAIQRLVFMGMGEPMDNLDELIPALEFITSGNGLGFSRKRVTVSTVGLCDKIRSFANSGCGVNLALSLHATEDKGRSKIVPAGKRNSIADVLDAAVFYRTKAKARVTIEYLLLDGVNDSDEDADRLGSISSRLEMPVNVISFNAVPGIRFAASKRLDSFATRLARRSKLTTVRRSKGSDIMAACGQLAGTQIGRAAK